MSSRASIKLNLAASWLNHGVALAIGVFLMPFVLHTLGDETYGTWIFINSVAGYTGFLYLGFGETACRFVATHHARQDWRQLNLVVNAVFFIYLLMGVIAFLASAVLAWFAPALHDWGSQSVTEVQLVILVLGLNVALSLPTCVFGGVLMGIQRFDIERTVGIASGLARLILTIVFLSADWGLLTLAVIFLVVSITEHLGIIVFAFRQVPTLSIRFRHFEWLSLRKLLGFSSFALLDVIAFNLISVTDTVVIGIVLGAKATVPYYIASRLCKMIGQPIRQIGRVFMPRAGQLQVSSERDVLQKLVTKGVGFAFLLVMGFFIGSAYFGSILIETWVGPGFQQSHWLLLILLGTQIVATPVDVLRSVLFGMGHVREQAFMNCAIAAANVILSIALVGPFGLMGVAFATAVPVILVELGVLLPFAIQKLRLDSGRLIREALAPQLLSLVGLLVYSYCVISHMHLQPGWLTVIAVSLGGGAVLAIGWLSQMGIERYINPAESVGGGELGQTT